MKLALLAAITPFLLGCGGGKIHTEADHASMPAMDHAAMPAMDHAKMDHSQMNHSQMDHSTMPATSPTVSDPATILRPDEFDAAAPSALGEAAKTATPPAHHHHGDGS